MGVAVLLGCLLVGRAAATTAPDEDFLVASGGLDVQNDQFQWTYEWNHFAGGGSPPALFLQGGLKWLGDDRDYTSQSAQTGFTWEFQIRALDVLPPGYVPEPVPWTAEWLIEGSTRGSGFIVNAGGSIGSSDSGNMGRYSGSSVSLRGTSRGYAMPGQGIPLSIGGGFSLFASASGRYSDGVLLIDPYLSVDPSYEYASYFAMYEAPGPNDGGVWQPTWNPVPLPGTGLLLCSGLGGLAAFTRVSRKGK